MAHDVLVEGVGLLRPRGLDEGGAVAAPRVAQERELGDDQHLAAHVLHGAVHLAVFVLEDAQVCDLLGGKARVLLAVARLHADEHEQAGADFRYEPAPDGNLGARDALDYDSHASDSFLASAMCSSDRPR